MNMYHRPIIKIIAQDKSSNNILFEQLIKDFESKPALDISQARYGSQLLDILLQEAKVEVSSSLTLKTINTGNVISDVTRLMGSIAEALIVNLCNEFEDINNELAMRARGGRRLSPVYEKYIAIATGSQRTKNYYNMHYNPNDTQRDIIWINKENHQEQLLCVRGSSTSAKPAGIQVKVSTDYNYVLNNILQYHYPVLYIDLYDDWFKLDNLIKNLNIKSTIEQGESYIPINLIHPDALSKEIKNILKAFFEILKEYFNNRLSLEDVAKIANYKGFTEIIAGIEGADITNTEISKLILPKLY